MTQEELEKREKQLHEKEERLYFEKEVQDSRIQGTVKGLIIVAVIYGLLIGIVLAKTIFQ